MSYSQMGDHDRAMACVRRANELMSGALGRPLTQSWLAVIELNAENPTRARGAVARLEELSRTEYVDPLAIAWIQYALGDHNAMFASLERGSEVRAPTMVFLRQVGQFLLREVHADARYEGLIRRMGLPAAG